MVKQGWGRIVNVTTMLQTMGRSEFCPVRPLEGGARDGEPGVGEGARR